MRFWFSFLWLLILVACIPPNTQTVPTSCEGIHLEPVELFGTQFLEANPANITYTLFGGSYSAKITFDVQTGITTMDEFTQPSATCKFGNCVCLREPCRILQAYGHPLALAHKDITAWLLSHSDYNPEWKIEIEKTVQCFDDILSSTENVSNAA